jgi:hypothetical protein
MSRPAELSADWRRCRPGRRCRRWSCEYCGPLRAGDEYRKFQDNIAAYGGRVVLVAVTALGANEGLPWDSDRCEIQNSHKHGGNRGCRVVRDLAYEWNETASERYARMWKAASVEADRWLRRLGYRGPMPRRVANAWAPQQRGVWHVHEALPGATATELQWSLLVVEYIARNSRRYKWGNIDRNPLRRATGNTASDGTHAARYLARNAAGYLAANVDGASLPGRALRSYVSRRLTSKTGVTIRNLRRVRYVFVLLQKGLPLPEWPEVELELVWRLLAEGIAIRGP